MSDKRVSDMTGDEIRELAGARQPVTYHEASDRYRGTTEARDRFDELTSRELSFQAFAKLKARGTYDPEKHGDADKYEPLTTAEHLEILAAGEVLARYYPARIDQALNAGATWQQVADATGCDPGQARQDYREWADGQHRLWADYDGKFGMDADQHAAAVNRAAEPEREAG